MPIPHAITGLNKRVLNRVTRRLVGVGGIAELEHVGRRSGRPFRTPVMAFVDDGHVTIALTYGPDVDWLKNLAAAGGGRLRTGSGTLVLGAPEHLHGTAWRAALPQPQRSLLRWPIRCEDAVRLPVLTA